MTARNERWSLPHETLLAVLRREGYFGITHGYEDGSCGACTVLVDGVPHYGGR